MTQEELINVFRYIATKCDLLVNNDEYKADTFTQDTVEDIGELCSHILDGDYGKLTKAKEDDLGKELNYDDYIKFFKEHPEYNDGSWGFEECWTFAEYCFKLGLKAAQEGE